MPFIDQKCSMKKSCWYCKDLCSTCLAKPSAFGVASSGPGDLTFNFCSSTCHAFHPDKASVSRSLVVCDANGKQVHCVGPCYPTLEYRCSPVEPSHIELGHIFVLDTDADGFPANIEIALCCGDGSESFPKSRYYAVLYQRTLCYQVFFEFFILDFDFLPHDPLPYYCDTSIAEIKDQLDKIPIQGYIKEAMSVLGPLIEQDA